MIRWLSGRKDLEREAALLNDFSHDIEARINKKKSFSGYCVHCNETVIFTIQRAKDGGWTDLRESIQCKCGLNGRQRMVWSVFLETKPSMRFLMLERVTPFFDIVARAYPFVEGCEYFGDNCAPGSLHSFGQNIIRHESLVDLSYDSNVFSYLFHGDVLEHVPDHRKALSECHRVLQPGGTLLFTAPFFFIEHNIIRCTVIDGVVQHHLPAAYHGNPVNNQGSLVFTEFGWELLDEIHSIGFSDVSVGLLYDPRQGIVSNNNPYLEGHTWPLIFKLQK